MKIELLHLLVAPGTDDPLVLESVSERKGNEIITAVLIEPKSGKQFPVVNSIPRFVPENNYAANFGLEWSVHHQTQYDDYTSLNLSSERFWRETKWPRRLLGEIILEVGCGSGRFTRHALKSGATVVSVDYSNAVESCHVANMDQGNLLVVQADIYQLPFRKSSFDKCFCFGVLQHTPDPRKSFHCIVEMLRSGGVLAADIYPKNLKYWLCNPKYWVRPFTRGCDPAKLYRFVRAYVNFMWPVACLLRRIPKVGSSLNWLLLIADHSRVLRNSPDKILKEWACLDTFDMLSPKYDLPQTERTFRRWFEEARMSNIDVHPGYNGYEGRGQRC